MAEPAAAVGRPAILAMLVQRDETAQRVVAAWPRVSADLLDAGDRLALDVARVSGATFRDVARVLPALRAHAVLRDDMTVDPDAARIADAALLRGPERSFKASRCDDE